MKRLFFFILLAPFLMGCSSNDGIDNNGRKNIELSRSEEVMTEETLDFAFRFFQQVNKSEMEQANWMVSPLSAGMALGMITNGASGNTLKEMKATLGFSQASIDEMNAYYRRLLTEMPGLDKTTQLSLANSIWIDNGFQVKSPFVDVNEQMYNAKVSNLDFTSVNAPTTINNWCSDHTNGRIPKVLKEIAPGTQMLLLNALYFKGIWKKGYKFEKLNTQDEDFTNADGSITKVKMMNQTNRYRYTSNDYFGIADFDYGNGAYSMTIFLPNTDRTFEECLEALTAENWVAWGKELSNRKLYVKMPRLEIEYNKDLKEDMKALGMKDAFNSAAADFSNISNNDLYLGLLKQFTYLKVDEEGTEAAAVTVGGMSNAAPPILEEPTPFYLNRPFVFMIRESSTGTILFMGKVTKM